jgi:hypothetical protein
VASPQRTGPLRISVILEGDNEQHCPENESGPICLGLAGLLEQQFPLEQVELLLVGNQWQLERWERVLSGTAIGSMTAIPVVSEEYVEMKDQGSAAASCPLVALLDSDVRPGPKWLGSIVSTLEEDAEIASGLTQLEWHGKFGPDSALMLAIGSISWGGILGASGILGFHANNCGFKADLKRVAWYRAGLLRACAAEELFRAWTAAGARAKFQSEQRVVHAFSLGWWAGMHARSGRESIELRRMFTDWPHQWVRQTGPLEPVLTALWRIANDPGQWFRYTKAAGVSSVKRFLYLPVLVGASLATRGVEMIGGYRCLLSHRRLR